MDRSTITTPDIKEAFLSAFLDPQFMIKGLPVWQNMNTFMWHRIDFHGVLDNLPSGHPLGLLWAAFCDLDFASVDVREARKTAGRNGPAYGHWVVAAEEYREEARRAFEKVCVDLRTCLTLGLVV
jgi:hypothetical protein